MDDVKMLSDLSLQDEGFSAEEIQSGANRPDCFVGEKNGIKYYRAQNELNINLGDHKTRSVRMPDQQGDKTS